MDHEHGVDDGSSGRGGGGGGGDGDATHNKTPRSLYGDSPRVDVACMHCRRGRCRRQVVMSSEGVVISTITSAAHPLETTMVEDCTAWTNQVDVEAAQHHVKLEGQEVSTRRELRPQLKSHRSFPHSPH